MTLTEAAKVTRLGFRFLFIPFIAILCIWIILGALHTQPSLPERYITPDYMCGPLPKIDIPSITMTSTQQIRIETESGAIPALPKVVNVYLYNHPGQSLLAEREMQSIAGRLGFDSKSYTKISGTEYKWKDVTSHKTLIIESSNQNIRMTTDFSSPAVDTRSGTLPSPEAAETIARNYLREMSLLTKDYDSGTRKTHLIQLTSNGEMRQAPSLSEADMIRVDFFRKKSLITIDPTLVGTEELGSRLSDELAEQKAVRVETRDSKSATVKTYDTRIFNESPIFGNIRVYLGGNTSNIRNDYEVFGLEVFNWVIGAYACGTYALISPQEAVRIVQDGEASLVYLMEKGGDAIIPYEAKNVIDMTILDVTLAYWEPESRQEFLQPIFVILGEAHFGGGVYGDFYYFVPAIDYESIPHDSGIPQTEG